MSLGERDIAQAGLMVESYMRFLKGRTLTDAIRVFHERRASGQAGPLELRELLTAFVGVCNAVAYAHKFLGQVEAESGKRN
jgi:hypothetical protein